MFTRIGRWKARPRVCGNEAQCGLHCSQAVAETAADVIDPRRPLSAGARGCDLQLQERQTLHLGGDGCGG